MNEREQYQQLIAEKLKKFTKLILVGVLAIVILVGVMASLESVPVNSVGVKYETLL